MPVAGRFDKEFFIIKTMRELPKITQEEWKEARQDFDKAVELYLRGKTKDETFEEKKARINRFRCGGF